MMAPVLDDTCLAAIRAHAQMDCPREACGLVVVRHGRLRYIPCRNIAQGPQHFQIDPVDQVAAEEAGAVVMVVHSHPNLPAVPSASDVVGCDASRLPWLIISWPSGDMHTLLPQVTTATLEGRAFVFGQQDCYTLIRDYYAQRLGVKLPDFERDESRWRAGHSYYLAGYQAAGFELVAGDLLPHDVLLMQSANHGAVYLDDGWMLHHQVGRLSSRDVYTDWHRQHTTHVLRHRSTLS